MCDYRLVRLASVLGHRAELFASRRTIDLALAASSAARTTRSPFPFLSFILLLS